jgi:hypothetical protein
MSLLQQFRELLLEATQARNGDAAHIRLVGVASLIILVIVLGFPKLLEGSDFGYDRGIKLPRGIQFRDVVSR